MHNGERESARYRPSLALICLTLFVVLLPLTLSKPGLPTVTKADEAAFYLSSLSLWHDGDLECEDLDVRRLFREYYASNNLLLMSKGQGQPVYFSVPIPYPLAATPFVAVFGANGMVLLNAILLMGMVWMGVAYLRAYNSATVSILFTVGFYLLSTAFVYVFWLQAEVFNMAFVMVSFFLIEKAFERPAPSVHRGREAWRFGLLVVGAAAALAIVIYSKPMLVVLALPMLYRLLSARSWRGIAMFALSGVLTAVALAGLSYGLTEQFWPYFAPRKGISVSSPINYIERRVNLGGSQESPASPIGQISQSGKELSVTLPSIVREALPEFLFGRHGGLVIYMPFAVLALLLFLLHDRRSVYRWLILASTFLAAVLFVTLVRGQWLGGGGFVGNRYFLSVYPAFFFLIRRVQPPWVTALGYAASAVFLGPLLITPLGSVVSHPTLQAHVRNAPFPLLPLEWSVVKSLSGYWYLPQPGASFYGRRDEILARGEEIWVQGAKRVEMSLLSRSPNRGFVFEVRNLAAGNEIEICVQSDCQQLAFDEVPPSGSKRQVTFEPTDAETIPRARRWEAGYRYTIEVSSTWGEQPRWRGSSDDRFYLGAALRLLGSPEELARDLYSVEWLSVEAPPTMPAGGRITIPIEIRNSSSHKWPSKGATRVRTFYRWLNDKGETVVRRGKRSELPADVAAGGTVRSEVLVEAPEVPGLYTLELDLLRGRVSWFSAKNPNLTYRVDLEVVAPAADLEARATPPIVDVSEEG
jgi:hypothetical protein